MLKLKTEGTDVVSRLELEAIKRKRKQLEAQRAEVEELTRELRDREQDVIARIEAGVPVDGQAVVITRRRQNISWLSVVKRELGAEAVIRTKNAWPVAFYKDLQID
jgi:competence CoiA-like predicted nuclease